MQDSRVPDRRVEPGLAVGNMAGTPIVAAVEWYLKRYGTAAGHEVVVRMPQRWRGWLVPNSQNLGLLGAKWYPYPFVGDVMRTMMQGVRISDEDQFIRDVAAAGIDASVGTIARVLLRYAATPQSLAAHGPSAWRLFHDSGQVSVVCTENEYVSTIAEWPNHEPLVCRLAMEVRRRLIERTGRRVIECRRDRCVGWGHPHCVVRLRW